MILSGVDENAAEQPGAAVGRGDAAKEKEEVGNVQEAEKPNGKTEFLCVRLRCRRSKLFPFCHSTRGPEAEGGRDNQRGWRAAGGAAPSLETSSASPPTTAAACIHR